MQVGQRKGVEQGGYILMCRVGGVGCGVGCDRRPCSARRFAETFMSDSAQAKPLAQDRDGDSCGQRVMLTRHSENHRCPDPRGPW